MQDAPHILPATQNETGLAAVMGLEIDHAVAKRGNERMSQALVTKLGGQKVTVKWQLRCLMILL